MDKLTTISLGSHFENFIAEALSSGRYSNTNDIIKAALRLLEDQENKSKILNDALKEAEESGFINDFTEADFFQKINSKHSL